VAQQIVKRFYTEVSIAAGGGILLDGRPVRTPARVPLIVAFPQLAAAIAEEWRAQGASIDPRTMPLTGLANAAIDRVTPDPGSFASGLARYAETDLLCYRAAEPPDLVARQVEVWNPVLNWAGHRYDCAFALTSGIVHVPQPPETVARLSVAIAAYAPFALAALSPIVTIAGSIVIAFALAEGEIAADAAFDAAHLDELWQEEQWGADYFAAQARDARRADFMAAARFLELL
jgi:chaperone required for assembly of F1-ATPase